MQEYDGILRKQKSAVSSMAKERIGEAFPSDGRCGSVSRVYAQMIAQGENLLNDTV